MTSITGQNSLPSNSALLLDPSVTTLPVFICPEIGNFLSAGFLIGFEPYFVYGVVNSVFGVVNPGFY